jgi:hypothetical protein
VKTILGMYRFRPREDRILDRRSRLEISLRRARIVQRSLALSRAKREG